MAKKTCKAYRAAYKAGREDQRRETQRKEEQRKKDKHRRRELRAEQAKNAESAKTAKHNEISSRVKLLVIFLMFSFIAAILSITYSMSYYKNFKYDGRFGWDPFSWFIFTSLNTIFIVVFVFIYYITMKTNLNVISYIAAWMALTSYVMGLGACVWAAIIMFSHDMTLLYRNYQILQLLFIIQFLSLLGFYREMYLSYKTYVTM
jgi:cation transport ATPase